MKQYALRVTTDFPVVGSHIGYLGIDAASGGYPYNNGKMPVFFHNSNVADQHLKDVLNVTDTLREYSNGGKYVGYTVTCFLEKYREETNAPRYAVFDLVFDSLEFDFSDPMNIKTTLLRRVEVRGREAESYKTASEAFYQAKEIDLD